MSPRLPWASSRLFRSLATTTPTPDGTGVRDYIHVCDLASGHVAALNWMNGKTGVEIFNLGTGTGTSVLEVVAASPRLVARSCPT